MSRIQQAAAALLFAGSAFVSPVRGQTPPEPPDSAGAARQPAAEPAATPASSDSTPPPPSAPILRAHDWVLPEGSLVVNLPSDQTLPKGILQFLVTHRFRSPVRGSNAHSWYSLDSGADFGVGFAYSPLAHAEISLYRSGIQDDYELAAKFSARPGGPDSLLGLALRVGGDDRRDPLIVDPNGSLLPDARARTSFFAQGVVTLHLASGRVEISAVPTFSSRTTAEKNVVNVPVHAAVALSRSWNLQGEYQPPRRGVNGSIAIWTAAVEKVLYRHRFELVVSNATVTNVDERLSGDFALAQKRQRAFVRQRVPQQRLAHRLQPRSPVQAVERDRAGQARNGSGRICPERENREGRRTSERAPRTLPKSGRCGRSWRGRSHPRTERVVWGETPGPARCGKASRRGLR